MQIMLIFASVTERATLGRKFVSAIIVIRRTLRYTFHTLHVTARRVHSVHLNFTKLRTRPRFIDATAL